jgi:DNA invertase Pin-like site-specific DNA recombinase
MAPKKARAYSYTRFSTPEQAGGDSMRRQMEMAQRYATQNGLTLDESLQFNDAGKSAFRGSNAKGGGALALFLRAIEDGDVPAGSVLLIETADRLSRLPMRKALRILESIIEADVDVVFLDEGKRYDRAALDGMDLLIFLLKAFRGHEESATKSRRLKAAWHGKREKAKAGELPLLTRHMPAWLEERNGKPALIPERATIVKRIFERFLAGAGQERIARELNQDKVPCWGYGTRAAAEHWRKSYVAKILRNPATAGALIPHIEEHDAKTEKVRKVAQPAIRDYFPAAIDMATWERTRTLLKATGRTRGPVANILAGLAKCPDCKGAMERVYKGAKNGAAKLVCSWAKHGGVCTSRGVGLSEIERALAGQKFTPPHPDEALQIALRDADATVEAKRDAIQNLVDAIAERPSAALSQRLAKLESELDTHLAELAALHDQGAETDSQIVKRRGERLMAALATQPLDIPAANVALRECFSKVIVNWHDGTLALHWRHDGETEIAYTIESG